MAASGKAQALKDAYVEAIAKEAGPEVMAEAGAASLGDLAGKLGMEAGGPVASEVMDLDRRQVEYRNDGDNNVYYIRGGRMGTVPMSTHRDPQVAHPIRNAPAGYVNTIDMPPRLFMESQGHIRNGFVEGLR